MAEPLLLDPRLGVSATLERQADTLTAGGCRLQRRPPSCLVAIFGASGDLTSRKILPALARLYEVGGLPGDFAIVGLARSAMSHDQFRDKTRQTLAAHQSHHALVSDDSAWSEVAKRLFYFPLEYDDLEGYRALAESLGDIEETFGLPGNRIFYLATPPTLYKTVASRLGQAGLSGWRNTDEPWARIVVEKPFGRDLASARDLDHTLHDHFDEHQIFRIDHYLAKETIQNVLLFRFANAIFEPVWNRNFIEYVSIIAAESLGVEHRAGYYDEAGVLRDMFQNHMMQLLALAAMEPPSIFAADRVRDEKAKLYRSLRPFSTDKGFDEMVLGQYDHGQYPQDSPHVGPVPAYREEPGVKFTSMTPTFAMLKVRLDNWRWQGVPFYISSGKRLAKKLTRIVVQFKEVPHSMFRHVLGEHVTANRLILETSPHEGINMSFQVKSSGASFCLRTATMSFDFKQEDLGPPLDSYEKVLLDCMLGDQMLFWRQDAVELCWGFLTPVLEMCEACGELDKHLKFYPAASWGPPEANMIHLNYLKDLALDARTGLLP